MTYNFTKWIIRYVPGNSISENCTVRRLHGKDIMPLVVRINVLVILLRQSVCNHSDKNLSRLWGDGFSLTQICRSYLPSAAILYHIPSSVLALIHIFWTRWDSNRKLGLYCSYDFSVLRTSSKDCSALKF